MAVRSLSIEWDKDVAIKGCSIMAMWILFISQLYKNIERVDSSKRWCGLYAVELAYGWEKWK